MKWAASQDSQYHARIAHARAVWALQNRRGVTQNSFSQSKIVRHPQKTFLTWIFQIADLEQSTIVIFQRWVQAFYSHRTDRTIAMSIRSSSVVFYAGFRLDYPEYQHRMLAEDVVS